MSLTALAKEVFLPTRATKGDSRSNGLVYFISSTSYNDVVLLFITKVKWLFELPDGDV